MATKTSDSHDKPRSRPKRVGQTSVADRPDNYVGRKPASEKASRAARGSSKKTDTRPELLLRRALWSAGLRYRKNAAALLGKPDVVFPGAKVAVFCDGDFWHGRNWSARREKLSKGHNADYWLAKIERNMQRDANVTAALLDAGWSVVRVWESDVKRDVAAVVEVVRAALARLQRPTRMG